ncbi:hypothetical protein CTI14_23745 [Methylobacterium radiotolerans]|nr:hypothetical protein CTI14_23745 [Methylobacterium radiotolerans]
MDFPTLARQCAPDVHISTLSAVVRHESAFNPLAIGVNAKPHRSIRPKSKEEAVEAVRELMAKGVDFDVGYGQINVRNWKWLGVTPESIFDPCVNLASAQRVLVNCYQRAAKLHVPDRTHCMRRSVATTLATSHRASPMAMSARSLLARAWQFQPS